MFSKRQQQLNVQQKKAEDCYQKAKLILEGEITSFEDDLESILQTAAVLKHAEAMLMLGILLVEKYSDDKTYHRAFKYFKGAHEQGLLVAKFYLAACYCEGAGTEENSELAIKLFEEFVQAARTLQANKNSTTNVDKLLVKAVATLAQQYLNLSQLDKSYTDKAYSLLSMGEQYGDLNASHNLAILMLLKSETENDAAKKLKLQDFWLKRLSQLAEKHYAEAEFDLAVAYRWGKVNLEIDLKKSEDFFWHAALGGKYEAFYHLIFLYEDLNDQAKAIEAMTAGAMLGNKLCRKEYGFRILTTPTAAMKEIVLATNYLQEAANNGDADVLARCAQLYLIQYNQNPHRENAEAILEQVILNFRAAASTHLASKFDLAQVLIDHPGEFIRKSYEEAEKNLRQLLVRSDVELQAKAQSLLALLKEKQSQLVTVINKPKKNKKSQTKPAPLQFTPAQRNSQNFFKDDKPETSAAEIKQETIIIPSIIVPEEKKYELTLLQDNNKFQNTCASTARVNFILPNDVHDCLQELEKRGYSSFLAGGLVRNLLLGIAIKY